jgi:hypothetical protein
MSGGVVVHRRRLLLLVLSSAPFELMCRPTAPFELVCPPSRFVAVALLLLVASPLLFPSLLLSHSLVA